MRRNGARDNRRIALLHAVALAAVALLLLGAQAAGPATGSSSNSNSAAQRIRQASKKCIIDVYAAKNASLTEYRYMVTVIYAHIPHQCGCRILLKNRDDAAAAIRALPGYKQPAMVLVAARDIRPEELAAVEAAGPHARAKLVVVHQSDELNKYNVSWYPRVKAVFRNYHRSRAHLIKLTRYLKHDPAGWHQAHHRLASALASQDAVAADSSGPHTGGGGHMGSLAALGSAAAASTATAARRHLKVSAELSRPAQDDSNVFWIPLGFGECFVASPAMHADIEARPLLWSWTGSLGKKPERKAMVKALNTSRLMEHGVLHTYESFKGPEMLPPVRYSTLLYESKLVPLPPGLHPEQFRLYEALAAGTIPMILKEHANGGLAHVDVLGFKALWFDAWSDAPKVMMELLSNESMQHELSTWQAHNSMQYVRVMRLVRQTFAEHVCMLSPLHAASAA